MADFFLLMVDNGLSQPIEIFALVNQIGTGA